MPPPAAATSTAAAAATALVATASTTAAAASTAAAVVFDVAAVSTAFLFGRQHAGQPHWCCYWFRRRRRRLDGLPDRRRSGGRHDTLKSLPLGSRLAGFSFVRPLQLGDQQPRRHSVGRRCEMHTVACPYRCPVWRSKLLKRGLSRTKEFAKVDYPCPSSPASRRGGIEQPFFRAEKFFIEVLIN